MTNQPKQSAERKLKKVKINLMRNKQFALMSGLMMAGTTSIKDMKGYAYTNGYDEAYGREFIDSHSEKEIGFIVVHEAGHKMFRHLTVWQKLWKENRKLANAACDYVLNLFIYDMDRNESIIAFPRNPATGKRDGLFDERFRDMHVKQVFDILKQEQKNNPQKGKGQPGDGGDESEEDDGDGGGFDEHDWEDANGMTPEQAKEVEQEIDRAIRQGKMLHQKLNGKGSSGIDRALEELTTPKVDWRVELREFFTAVCNRKEDASYRRLNRRYVGLDLYLPIRISEAAGRGVIGIDMSGSIAAELPTFFTELSELANNVVPEHLDLLYWDGEVCGHETYGPDTYANMLSSTKPKGGGGTTPSCVTRFIHKEKLLPEFVVMFTDGYVGNDWGEAGSYKWPCPVLWLVVNKHERSITAPNGKTIFVRDFD